MSEDNEYIIGASIDESNKTEDLFSKLEASYQNYDYDSVNGKDEFNCLNEFLSPLTAVSSSLNLSDTYRADMYGIELTRINLSGKTITDGENDNDVGVIHIENSDDKSLFPRVCPLRYAFALECIRLPINISTQPDCTSLM